MPQWAVLTLVAMVVVAALAGAALFLRDRRENRREERPAASRPAPRVPEQRTAEPVPYRHPRDRKLTPPPMVGDLTLRDWLMHFSPSRDQVWPSVVATFYNRAASVPEIADYFRDTDMPKLQQHFARALTMVTGSGLDESTVRRLQDAHFRVTSSEGRPITPEIYDAAITTLVGVLAEEGVPAATLQQLAETIAPLRGVIARPAQPTPLDA
jgi:truncated hemoglobin YjbI